MRNILVLIIALLCIVTVYAETNTMIQTIPQDSNLPTFTVKGELRALAILGKREVTLPWRNSYTLEQVINDLGGFTDWSTHIIVEGDNIKRMRYAIGSDFKNDPNIRAMKIEPGMVIFVTPTMD